MINEHVLHQQGYDFLLNHLRRNKVSAPSFQTIVPTATAWLESQNYQVPRPEWERLRDSIIYALVGFGPLEVWLKDPAISEIMINNYDQVYLEKAGRLERSELTFTSNEQLLQIINRMVAPLGRRIDESQPMVDARLPDGSRINAIIPPLSLCGPVLTVRKFAAKPFTMSAMIESESINHWVAELFKLIVAQKQNILISGGTGAGKTSTLNALAGLIPNSERIITIEDSAEINIEHPHLITLESRVANVEGKGMVQIRDLLKNALRMRPDRILVGEIRGEEAIDMLQAMNTGHEGSITTVHANAPLESLYRLETMVLMGAVKLPLAAIRPQIKQGIHWILQQKRLANGSRKITEISYLEASTDRDGYDLKSVVRFNFVKRKFEATGYVPLVVTNHGSKQLQQWCKNK
jgi:pilus assembly protein CpaF